MRGRSAVLVSLVAVTLGAVANAGGRHGSELVIGAELGNPHPLIDGDEYRVPLEHLLRQGERVFSAVWTPQEGGGRPFSKGNGLPLADSSRPLVFPRNFNRVSAPDANSCFGCHAQPFGLAGGGGDIVANVFVLAQRFDFASFHALDVFPTGGAVAEDGRSVVLDDIGNSRATPGMFGSGFIEMLARQMTRDLQRLRDGLAPGAAVALVSKGVSFGTLRRDAGGRWDTSQAEGLPAPSLAAAGADAPDLIIRPFHQTGAVISLREFTVNAMNHHHGIQATERVGAGNDPDGDGFADELSRADVTAATIFQATLPVPGRVIPRVPALERAIAVGERLFAGIGCNTCHIDELPLDDEGWVFVEPNPFNPAGNLRPGDAPDLAVNLLDGRLPGPRLAVREGVVLVPAYSDLKLHDITSGADDPNREPLDMHQPPGSAGFFAGNGRFLTKKLWGAANEPPYFHHGKFSTLREAVLAHAGEAQAVTDAYLALATEEQDAVIEFLKSLQVLPPGSRHRIVDERGRPRPWP